MFFPVADYKKHADNLLMVAVGAQWSWFCACAFFQSKGSARLRRYDKLGNRDLIDDSVSSQNIQTGFVSSTGMFNRRKMF